METVTIRISIVDAVDILFAIENREITLSDETEQVLIDAIYK